MVVVVAGSIVEGVGGSEREWHEWWGGVSWEGGGQRPTEHHVWQTDIHGPGSEATYLFA